MSLPLQSPPAAASAASGASQRAGCGDFVFMTLAALWAVLIVAGGQTLAWFVDQTILSITDRALPTWVWLVVSIGTAVLLALPLVPLAVFIRPPRLRAIYQTWAVAAGFVLWLSPVRLFPGEWKEAAALTQMGLSLVAAAALLVAAWRRKQKLGWHWGTWLTAVALTPLVVFPFLQWGALGAPLETALDLGAGLSLGVFASALLVTGLLYPLQAEGDFTGRYFLGGLASGVTLLILGGGFGFGGSQLLLLVGLPPLGFAVLGLARLAGTDAAEAGQAWAGIAALVGLAAAAALMLIDSDELTLLLLGADILNWAFNAAWLSALLALVVGLGLRALPKPRQARRLAGLAAAALVLTWVAGVVLYALVGRPGFYGEALFVILKDQKDVSPAANIADRTERVRYVYTTLTQEANQSQASLRHTLDTLHITYHPYYLVNALEVNGGPLLRAYLASQPEVDRVLESPHLRPLPAPPGVSQGSEAAPVAPEWNLTQIGADRVWKELGVTGQGIVVGQSDSGVDGQHVVLRDGYRGRTSGNNYNWLDPWNHSTVPTDFGGHGTHTLGTAVGRNNVGVAPGAEWMGCVNLARNLGNPPVYLNCMQFMLAPYPQKGDAFTDGDPSLAAHVLNDSWGCPPLEGCDPNALAPAVNALRAAGIFVVASAGNSGYAGCGSVSDPLAVYASAFTVGAIDRQGDLANFSSRGPVTVDGSQRLKPDIVAPGVEVLSSTPGDTYASYDGTSMAGPHVVGTVALMWSANPKLVGNIDLTEQILRQTAQPYTGAPIGGSTCSTAQSPNNGVGYGVLDAYAAVKAALQAK